MDAAPAHARAAAADPRLIVALDLPTIGEARDLVEQIGDAVSFYKIGLQLLAGHGMSLAGELRDQGKQVFLDWKLHDIGATVEKAAAAAAERRRKRSPGAGAGVSRYGEYIENRHGLSGSRFRMSCHRTQM